MSMLASQGLQHCFVQSLFRLAVLWVNYRPGMEKPHQYTTFRASDKEAATKMRAPVCKGMPAKWDGGCDGSCVGFKPVKTT